MLLAAQDPVKHRLKFRSVRKRRRFELQDHRSRKRRCDTSGIQEVKRKRSNSPAKLSVSKSSRKRRRERDLEEKPVVKRKMSAFENGCGVSTKVGELEKCLEGLKLSEENNVEKKKTINDCKILVPVFKEKKVDLRMGPIKSGETPIHTFFTIDSTLVPCKTQRSQMNAEELSSNVLKLLVQLGFVERLNCMGENIYVVLKKRFMPIFSKPTGYYFQNNDIHRQTLREIFHKQINREKQKKKMNLKTLIGLWLLLVKLGYYLPFPQVERYSRFFAPINEVRLSKLGASWLKQLGIPEESFQDPSKMDEICKKIILSLQDGKRHIKQTAEPELMDIDDETIEVIS